MNIFCKFGNLWYDILSHNHFKSKLLWGAADDFMDGDQPRVRVANRKEDLVWNFVVIYLSVKPLKGLYITLQVKYQIRISS